MRPIYIGCGNAADGSEAKELATRFATRVQVLGGVATGSWVMGISVDEEGAQRMRREMAESNFAVCVVDLADPLSLVEFGAAIGMLLPVLVVSPFANEVSEIDKTDADEVEAAIEKVIEAAKLLESEQPVSVS